MQASDPNETAPAGPGRWLAIETSGLFGSIALGEVSEQKAVIRSATELPRDARSARTLAPAIAESLGAAGWAPDSIATVAVAAGPGSFTGLRVGVVTAKAFAYAAGAAVLGVDTLDALAEAAGPPDGAAGLWAVFDAQRSELFAARFTPEGDAWRRETPTERLGREELLSRANATDAVVGPTAATLGEGAVFRVLEPTAGAVLRVTRRAWLGGAMSNLYELAPEYHRLSAAEEKLQA